jgi:hypothetical protein
LQSILSGPEFTHKIGEPAGFILSDLRDRQHDAAQFEFGCARAEASGHFIRQN